MSAGYASRLSPYERKGVCGLPENFDTSRTLSNKLDRLVQWIQEANGRVVVLTGAGISTSAGIPDFRGPQGIWTLEQEEKKKKKKKNNKQQKQKQENKKRPRYDDDDEEEDDEEEESSDNEHSNSSSSFSVKRTKPLRKNQKKNKQQQQPKSQRSSATIPLTAPSQTSSSPTTPRLLLQDWSHAQPTYTHRAITKLIHMGVMRYCITQNVDGLHRRSGLSRSNFAALHGCAFTEKCDACHTEFFRDNDIGGISFAKTGRICTVCTNNNNNNTNNRHHDTTTTTTSDPTITTTTRTNGGTVGYLRDTLLDWDDALPEADLDRATMECERARLVICLGTSLRIEPVGSLPALAQRFVIVNLQETPKDAEAALIVRARVDDVMKELMTRLGYADWDHQQQQQQQDDVHPPIERVWTPPSSAIKNKSP